MTRRRVGGFAVKVVEILVTNLLVVLYFLFMVNQEKFLEMNLHPLVIIVSMFSIRYGIYYGVLSAGVASSVFLWAYYYLGKDMFVFFADFTYYKFFLIFFLAAIVLGRAKDNHDAKELSSRLRIEELEEKIEKFYDENKNYSELLKELKTQIIGAEYSLLSLYELAQSLQSLEPEDVYSKSVGIFRKFLRVEKMSFYTVEESGYLRLKLHYGESDGFKKLGHISEVPEMNKMLIEKEPMRRTKNSSRAFPIFIAPVINRTGVLNGMITIENMEFEKITDYNFSLFKVIVQWVNQSINYALEFDRTTNGEFHNFVSKEKFQALLKIHEERKKAFDLEFCQLDFKLSRPLDDSIKAKAQGLVRRVDYLAWNENETTLKFLFPATKKEHLEMLKKKIFDALQTAVNKEKEFNILDEQKSKKEEVNVENRLDKLCRILQVV